MARIAPLPYPQRWVRRVLLPDGASIIVRPIRPSDAEAGMAAFRGLSDRSRYQRFMMAVHDVAPDMVRHFTELDYQREMAFVATPESGGEILGVARYSGRRKSCEFAIVIQDAWQRRGLGKQLLRLLMRYARRRGYTIMRGSTFSTNQPMIKLAKQLGFATHFDPAELTVTLLARKLPLR